MTEKFKVGDDVFDLRFDWGKVTDEVIAERAYCCVPVSFQLGTRYYTREGKSGVIEAYPTLLTVEEAAKLGHVPQKKKIKRYPAIIRHEGGTTSVTYSPFVFKDEEQARICFQLIEGPEFIRLLTEAPELIEETEE